ARGCDAARSPAGPRPRAAGARADGGGSRPGAVQRSSPQYARTGTAYPGCPAPRMDPAWSAVPLRPRLAAMTHTLGTNGPTVTSPGLGAMSLSGAHGPTDDEEIIRVVRHYLDSGGTLIDTADFY